MNSSSPLLSAFFACLFVCSTCMAAPGEEHLRVGSWESWNDLQDSHWAEASIQVREKEVAVAALALQPGRESVFPILECEPLPSPSPSPVPATEAAPPSSPLVLLAPIPEASTLVLALLGTVGISMLRRRR